MHAQVKCTHVTEADYTRAAAGEWIRPGQLPPVSASVQPLGAGFAPGIPGSFQPTGMVIQGLPGQAPLSIPALTGGTPLPAAGAGLMAFPPPP